MSKNKVMQHGESENKHVKKARSPQSIEQHPILQLQQTIGNKAVTKMIQRHGKYALDNFDFKIRPHGESGGGHWLRGETLEQ